MYSFSCTAFVTKIAPLVQSTLQARLHTWRSGVYAACLQTVCEGMPRRKKLTYHSSTLQPPAKVPRLSDLSQPTDISTVASQRADILIYPALACQVEAMSSEKPQTEPVQLEAKLQHSADAVAGAVGFAGDSQLASEVAGVHDGSKKNRQGKKSAGKDYGGKKQGTRQPAQSRQSDFGNSYSQLVRQHRPVNRQGVVLREDTDDSVRSTDDPSSAGISDAGSSARGKRRNNAGNRPAQRSMTFFRKPVAPQSSLVDNKTTPDDSTDSITEAGASVGERRRRRRKKKPLPSGPLQLEPSELKPEADLLEDAVPPTSSMSRGINLRESVSSDEVGNSLSKNFLQGSPKARTAKSTRPRQRSKRNKPFQAVQSTLDEPQAEQHGDGDCSGLGSFAAEAAGPVPGATGTQSSASRRGDPHHTNQGRGNRLPPNRNQAGQRHLTFYRKKPTEKSSLQESVTEPNSTQMSSETPEQMTPTSTRKKRGKYNKASKKATMGLLPSQSTAVAQTLQTESLEALPSPGAGQGGSSAQGLPVRPHCEGQGEVVEKPKGEATETKAEAKVDVIPLPQRKRPTKTKTKLTAANAKEKTKPIPVSKGGSKLVAKASDKATISAAAGWGRGNSEEKDVASGVLQAAPLDCASVDSPDAATTDDGAGEAQKGKRTKRRKRKLLSSSGAGSSAPSESVGAEETADEVANSPPAELVPKKKKGGKLSPHGGQDPEAAEPAKGKSDKKAVRKHRPKIIPDSLLSLVTACVKRDPNLAKKLGTLSIAEEVRKKTEHALSGRKHRSSESDCPPEDSKKAKLSSAAEVDEAGGQLSGDSSDTESTKASAATAASDDILGIIADISPRIPLVESYGEDMSAKASKKKKKKNKKKKKGKHSAAADNEEGTDDKDEKKKEKPRKIIPNYFVAIQVDDPEIQEGLQRVQRHVLLQNLGLVPAFIPLPTLHLTLAVMHLATQQDIDRAKAVLDSSCQELRGQYPKDPLTLHVSGLDTFRNQVVFARVRKDEALQQLKEIAATVEKALCEEKLLNSDKDNFKAHITIMKTSKAYIQLRKKGIKSIPPETYSDFLHADFGVQYAHRLQLCSMMKKKQKDGYYHVEHEVNFAPESGETTRLQKFCRRLAKQSVQAALQKLREERGLTAEAEKEAEMMQLSKSIVTFSVQSAVAQLKDEQWRQRKQEKKEAEKRERKEERKEKKEKKKKGKGAKAAAGTEVVQAAAEGTESQAEEEGKVGTAAAGIEASKDTSTAAAAQPEQAETQATGGKSSSGGAMPGEVRDEVEDSKEVKDGKTAGEQVGSGGEREGPVPVVMKEALEGQEPGDSKEREDRVEKEGGDEEEKEREDGVEKERGDGEEKERELEEMGAEGAIAAAELDALCKELVEKCVEEALQQFRKQNPSPDREEDEEDEGTSV